MKNTQSKIIKTLVYIGIISGLIFIYGLYFSKDTEVSYTLLKTIMPISSIIIILKVWFI